MNIIKSRGFLRIFFTVIIFLNIILPAGCQTRITGQDTLAAGPTWDGVPGEFKATVLGPLRPGDPFVVAAAGAGIPQGGRMQAVLVRGDRQLSRAIFFCLGSVSRRGPVSTAVMAVPVGAGGGSATLRIEAAGRVLYSLQLDIENRIFETQTFTITGAMSDIITVPPDPERRRQAEQMWAIWARTGERIYTLGNFAPPVVSDFITSAFGLRRTYRHPDGRTTTSVHTGVDWRAPTGTPITAPAPGRVVLAMDRIVTGKTVVIEHMPGVYSLYFHLNRIAVSEGDIVQTGTRLGDAGATGFATGPHLHYEIRVSTEFVDPASFEGRTILDKSAILAILNL